MGTRYDATIIVGQTVFERQVLTPDWNASQGVEIKHTWAKGKIGRKGRKKGEIYILEERRKGTRNRTNNHQSINQSINQSFIRSVNQSINRSINKPIHQSVD